MKDKALASVITIFLDAERFIEEAIESVFAQTYDTWELLLVDDGSIDGSTEIAQRYAKRYPGKVRYLEHEGHQNRGMSASRNLGIRNAKGDYIALLDADDVWLPQNLERLVALLSSHPEAGMVYGATRWWYSWMGDPEDAQRDFVHELGLPADTLVQPPEPVTLFLRNEGASPCTCSVLMRREVVEWMGGFEESFRGMYEDQAFFSKLCLKVPAYVSGECWSKYRQHPGSCVSQTQNSSSARLFFLTWLERYLSQNGIDDAEVWRSLKAELWPYRHPLLHRAKRWLTLRWENRPSFVRVRQWAYSLAARFLRQPIVRQLRCAQFRRLEPFGKGRQRGTPVVRYYWASFLEKHRSDIKGRALEIGTTATLQEYGGQNVTQVDAIDLEAHSPEITVVADLSRADSVPANTYDCFVNQFSMHVIHDVEAALYHSIRILKTGGVLLVNFSCLDYYFARGLDMGTGAPLFIHWWFTPIQVENLLRRVGLSDADYSLSTHGNLFARVAYQMNMPAEELTRRELEYADPGHPLLICVRAVKPVDWQAPKPEYRNAWLPGIAPARWNPVTGHYTT